VLKKNIKRCRGGGEEDIGSLYRGRQLVVKNSRLRLKSVALVTGYFRKGN